MSNEVQDRWASRIAFMSESAIAALTMLMSQRPMPGGAERYSSEEIADLNEDAWDIAKDAADERDLVIEDELRKQLQRSIWGQREYLRAEMTRIAGSDAAAEMLTVFDDFVEACITSKGNPVDALVAAFRIGAVLFHGEVKDTGDV